MSGDPILIVDDDLAACQFLADALQAEGFEPICTVDPRTTLKLAATQRVRAVVTDLEMPGLSGQQLCEMLRSELPAVPVIVVTAFGSVDSAVEAMRAGAYDFIVKPFEVQAVALTLRRAIEHCSLRQEVAQLRQNVQLGTQYGEMLGNSSAMREVYDLISRVATSDAPLLVTGESGTGKDLVARELHRRGSRHNGPFVAVNCAAMPETLLESELFGHVRGAFTDAKTARDGLFVQAHGGTIFLDEIAEMPIGLQPKLLRALQERCVRPLGGRAEVPFDARLVTATNRDLETAIAQREFREDLYYRINVVHVDLPPLRARSGDVLLLARAFLQQLSAAATQKVHAVSVQAAEQLTLYPWPGNVRELRNCVERAVALCRGTTIECSDLPPKIRDFQSDHVLVAGRDPRELAPLEEVERRYVLHVLEACQGNKSAAAAVLGLSRKTLYRKLELWGIEATGS